MNRSYDEKPLIEDCFRSKISSKLKTIFDGLASQLESISQDKQSESHHEKIALQNFIISAKSQISRLLCKNNEIPLQSCSPKPKSLVSSLQIEISSRLQDLLCKAIEKNAADKLTNGVVEETEWPELSHLLQHFLSSAKKKISFSLGSNECAIQTGQGGVAHKQCTKQFCDNKSSLSEGKTTEDMDSDSSSHSGILLLGEADRAPDYLDLSLEVEESDVDDPQFDNGVDESDEEVVVLGEKRPTYPEITLDEDEEGEVCESVVEMQKRPVRIPKNLEDLLYDCPKCEKKFRVESLLKFHVRMHSVVESHGRPPTPQDTPQRYCRKEKENNKLSSKSSRQHKIQKHKRKKVKNAS